jgi:toxin FitB
VRSAPCSLVSRCSRRRTFPKRSRVGEIRQGAERLRRRNARQATALENWLEEILRAFGDRVLPLNERIAQIWGRFNSPDVLRVVDSLLAATAQAHGLTRVTRNVKDIERSGVRCLNPFESVETNR